MKKKEKKFSKIDFATFLLKWNQQKNTRQMPWKGEKNPYKIWLSEIILQQTRVEQGLSYYNNFIKTFSDIHKLAKASDEKIFKMWEGLGYYTRCRNLIATARFISNDLKGKFPEKYEEIKALKGIGPYTAAAISSFAYNLPHAVVDGNVYRVLARVFGIAAAIDNVAGKKLFNNLADDLLDKKTPGLYNQAIMDFGAVVCKPVAPLCISCVFKKNCLAFLNDRVKQLPVKEKKLVIRKRWFYYLVLEYKNTVAIHKRTEKDIWQDLYEFPLIEAENEISLKEIIQHAIKNKWTVYKTDKEIIASSIYKQQLTHQSISGQFLTVQLDKKPTEARQWIWVNKKNLRDYSFPQFINQHLRKNT